MKKLFATSSSFVSSDVSTTGDLQKAIHDRSSEMSTASSLIEETGSRIRALSYLAILPTPQGVFIDVYTYTDDVDLLGSHLYAHLDHLADIWCRLARHTIYFPTIAASQDVVEEIILAAGGGSEAVHERQIVELVLGVQPVEGNKIMNPHLLSLHSFTANTNRTFSQLNQ